MKVKEERHHKVLTDENIAGGDAAGLQAELERLASLAGASNHDKVPAGKTIEEEKKQKLSNVLQHRPIFKACDDEISFTAAT